MMNKTKRVAGPILCVLLIVVMIISGCYIYHTLVAKPHQTQENFHNIKKAVKEEVDSPESTCCSDEDEKQLDDDRISLTEIKAVQDDYPDVIGWIQIPGTQVDYPVVQSGTDNPEYYLRRDLDGNYSTAGCLFLDASCGLEQDINVVYGHNMTDGTMFRHLIKYLAPDEVNAHPKIYFDTANGQNDYLICAVFKTSVDAGLSDYFPYVRYHFDTAEDKVQYLYDVMARSMIHTEIPLNEKDDLLILSTCEYDFDDCRLVLMARKIRKDETYTVSAKANESPLQISSWYEVYGGERPDVPEDFQTGYSKGLMSWYDGKVDLSPQEGSDAP